MTARYYDAWLDARGGYDHDAEPDTCTDDERERDDAEIRREIEADLDAIRAMEQDRANAVDGWFVAPFDAEPW